MLLEAFDEYRHNWFVYETTASIAGHAACLHIRLVNLIDSVLADIW